MPSSNQILSVLAAIAVATTNAAMGPAFSTGPVGSGSWIREATSTLVLPDVPQGSTGVASLWVGMGTDKGDLIQSIADNWQSDEWSIFAYTLTKTGDNSQLPVQDEYQAPAKTGDRVTMHYKYDDSTQEYVQYVSINGKQVSTLSTSKGHEAMGFGSSVECGASDCGTIGAHQWVDTKIILNTADPNYIQTFGKGEGVTGGEMTTSDGGQTWVISDSTIKFKPFINPIVRYLIIPLRQLYPDPKAGDNDAPRQSIDIIADHGLDPPAKGEAKHAFDTWRTPSGQKGRSWLQQDLPDHIPDSRIFLYQYNTTAAYGRSLDGFRSKADNLLEAMSIERRECPGRPILLLGHNTGGLLIKQALINAHRNPGYNAIKDDTTGIVFFGTPHELITQKLGEIVTAIAREIGHETEGDLLRSLQAGSTFSELESWKHQVLQHNTVSFWGSSDTTPATEDSAGLTTPIGLKIVVENLKRLYKLTIEKPESQYDAYPDTSGVETPLTSEDYGQDEHHDVLEEIQRVALSTTCEIDQPIMTPSQESRLQDDEPIVQDSLKTTCYHSTIKGAPAFTGTALQDRHIAGNQAIPLEAQDKLYSRMSFNFLILQEPLLQGIRYLNYQKPTNVQEVVLSALMLLPRRNAIASYPPETGRTTALAIALLSRIFLFSTTEPQVLVIVATPLLVHQMEKSIKEMRRFCEELVIETITPSRPIAKVKANVIIATPGSLLDCIRRKLVEISLVKFLLMDDVDYLVDLSGLSDRCIRVARSLPKAV
ncbi:hypothetical protein FVER53590_03468 [Fusarium verticillioides]|nr:hypothetical protein FVER53590_03468 [Fusarium verticillioides]